jgi:hypothetical protein
MYSWVSIAMLSLKKNVARFPKLQTRLPIDACAEMLKRKGIVKVKTYGNDMVVINA